MCLSKYLYMYFFNYNSVVSCFYHVYAHLCIIKEHPFIFPSLPLFTIPPSTLHYTFFFQKRNHSFTFHSYIASDLHHSICFYTLYIFKDRVRRDTHFSSFQFTLALHMTYIHLNNLVSSLSCYLYK